LGRENEKVKRFLFDVDGTLTDSRQKIDSEFEEFMIDFCIVNKVALVTGSDKNKTVEQIGEKLFSSVDYSFNCAGNEVWHKNNLIYKTDWTPSEELMEYLQQIVNQSKFSIRTGNHIELRNGMLNLSIIGRNCTLDQRKEYIQWDKSTSERERLQAKISARFDYLDVFIGGETGLDIYQKGKNKEQVIDFLKNHETPGKYYYFGDQIFKNGNDYNIAMRCENRYQVRGWRDTYEILKFLEEVGIVE
jgi:phosphomannomutase